MLLGLRLNKVVLQAGQDRLGLCERQSHRRRRAAGRGAAAGVHLMHLLGTDTAPDTSNMTATAPGLSHIP